MEEAIWSEGGFPQIDLDLAASLEIDAGRVADIRSKIDVLRKQPVLAQGSQEWLDARRLIISASEAASFLDKSEECAGAYAKAMGIDATFDYSRKCASSYHTSDQLIRQKYASGKMGAVIEGTPPPEKPSEFLQSLFDYGHRFEPVARDLYRYLNGNCDVEEFGLIRNPALPILGASPDGVIVSEQSAKFGFALEIKSPVKRKLVKGLVPYGYWIQIQLQMALMDLPAADYIEVTFMERYADAADFASDTDPHFRGAAIFINPAHQILPPISLFGDPLAQLDWCQRTVSDPSQPFTFGRPLSFWKVADYNMVHVPREREWFEEIAYPRLKLGYERMRTYDPRADVPKPPTKRKRASNDGGIIKRMPVECVI